MPKAVTHTHKFKRHHYKNTGSKMFFCILPDCHYKIDVALSLGKRAVCWRCSRDFILNEYSIRLAKPHCENCTKTKDDVKSDIKVEEITKAVANTAAEELRAKLNKSLTPATTALKSPFAAQPDEHEI